MKKYVVKSVELASVQSSSVFIGADVAKKSMVVATVLRHNDGSLEVLERRTLSSTREAVAAYARRFPGAHWVYEAGPTGYRLLLWLKDLGVDAFMTAPSLVPVAAGDRVKTNTRDAVKLATAAAGGQLKRIKPLTEEQYADRSLVRCRRQAVNARSDVIRQIKSLLLFHGIPIRDLLGAEEGEEVSEQMSQRFLKALKDVTGVHPSLATCLRLEGERYIKAHASVREYDKALSKLAQQSRFKPPCKLLRTIGGIGVVSAMEVVVERGGDRFERGSSFAAYGGLTPAESSTGERTRRGRITRSGNAPLRSTLVEAAWRLIRVDPWAAEFFERIRKRHGNKDGASKKAIVAVARRLAVAIHAMLRDNTPWSPAVAAGTI